jgi:hypothetical protein
METIENKYCFECENRVGKKEKKGKWIYYTENTILFQLYDDISIYVCIDCHPNPELWECKVCNQMYDSNIEFCDENGDRKCSNCIIQDLFIMTCECNVCSEIYDSNIIIPK